MNTDYNCYELSKEQWNKFCIVGYVVMTLLCLLFYHSLIFAAVCGLTVFFARDRYSSYMAKKRRAFLIIQFKDMLYSIAASVATGRQMPVAIEEALENLRRNYDEETPLIKELSFMVRGMRENRESEAKLLTNFAFRSHIEDIRNFVDIYLACRLTGGNLEHAVARAVEIISEKMTIEREIKTLTAQKQYEGVIITLIPIGVLLLLNIFSPDYIEPLYTVPAGRLIMTVALLGIGVAWLLTSKLTDIEV